MGLFSKKAPQQPVRPEQVQRLTNARDEWLDAGIDLFAGEDTPAESGRRFRRAEAAWDAAQRNSTPAEIDQSHGTSR